MSDAAELKKLVKQLQSAQTEADTISILNTLKHNFEVNEPLLRESRAGLAVGKLRAHASKQVSDLAKEIVKKWKNEVEKAKALQGQQGGVSKPNVKIPERKQSVASSVPGTPLTPVAQRSAKIDGVKTEFLGDKTRDKCIELLYDSLASDSGAPTDLIVQRARSIEVAVHTEFGGTTAAYKTKIRSLFTNLKDAKNPGLRENVVSGDLPVERFAKMTSQEMASAERKAADEKIKEENLYNSLGAEEQQAETEAFQCAKCKQRKCRYRQAQTRSADEPMTTFVTCVNCNHRWKFS